MQIVGSLHRLLLLLLLVMMVVEVGAGRVGRQMIRRRVRIVVLGVVGCLQAVRGVLGTWRIGGPRVAGRADKALRVHPRRSGGGILSSSTDL